MQQKNTFGIAFYNLENLFDTVDDPHILDDDFTPKGFNKWKDKRYRRKLKKLAYAISKIGEEDRVAPPILIGIAEVENSNVVRKLITQDALKNEPYDFVHFDSPDERGIDTGLVYNTRHFKVLSSETMPLLITNGFGKRDYTRDILYVHGKLNGEVVHIFVNHWPSRRDGASATEHKRVKAAQLILQKIATIQESPESLNCIIMGDFNDDPNSVSIKHLMQSGLFINPMQKLLSPHSGSAKYKGKWNLFDQILISHSFLNLEKGTHTFEKARIFAPDFLKEWKGKYKGSPFRTFAGKKFLGGYSDHFPVYLLLKYFK